MALTYDEITAITEKKFMPKLVDNIFNKNKALQELKKNEKPQSGGDKCVVPLNYAKSGAGGWYEGAETLDTSDSEVISAAEFEWKQLYENISITRRDELRNSGDAAKVNFVRSKMEVAERTIRDRLNTAIFNTGSDSKQVAGINAFLSTSNTYGGISQTDYSWWAGQVDSTTTTLTLAAMQSLWGDCGEGTEYPTMLLGDQDMYDRYWNLLQPQQRFSKEGDGGFKNIMFNSAPLYVDAAATAGDLYMLNMDYLHLMPHKDENFRFDGFIKRDNQNAKTAKSLGKLEFDDSEYLLAA